MKNTEILRRKGLSEEQISELEEVCLDTRKILEEHGALRTDAEMGDAFETFTRADEIFETLKANEKLKRRMHAISPIEGRYDRYVEGLHDLTSEFEWNRRRVMVEVEYLIDLVYELNCNYEGTQNPVVHGAFSGEVKERLRSLYKKFSEDDFRRIQLLDRKINHDIVAMTTWIAYEMGDSMACLADEVEAALHFARTSEDININVYNLIVKDMIKEYYLPAVVKFQEDLISRIRSWADAVFAGQTHGQYAEYTTLRKVFANFVSAIDQTLKNFLTPDGKAINLPGKLGGAVGNENDIAAAYPGGYPDRLWLDFNKEFVEKTLGLEYAEMCDQPEFNIKNQEIYENIRRTNNVLMKVCSDFWTYCSRGLFRKKTGKGESGSSVMAQKANPWLSEGAEEYFIEANEAFLGFERLIKYRMQGDLRRSTQMRGIGEPFAKTIIAIKRLGEELNKYEPNYDSIKQEVDSHPEMSAAAVQTVLRREGIPEAYDILKDMTMGKPVQRDDYIKLADRLLADGKISEEVKKDIVRVVTPGHNIGYAPYLADRAVSNAVHTLESLKGAYRIVK
jgi:adenylosuccinate lyase